MNNYCEGLFATCTSGEMHVKHVKGTQWYGGMVW